MIWAGYFLLFAAGWGMSWLISARLPAFLEKRGVFDIKSLPEKRYTAGGIAIILPVMAVLAAAAVFNPLAFNTGRPQLLGLLASFAVIAALGLYDDLRGASPALKLAAQTAAVLPLLAGGIGFSTVTGPVSGAFFGGGWAYLAFFLWILVVTNSINLIDGIDGLASGISLISAASLFVIAVLFHEDTLASFSAVLAGGITGFIRLNLPPAKVFLGDTGSLFLGFSLAAVSVLERRKGAAAITLLAPVVILAVPLLDTALAILRRLLRGQNPLRGDSEHLHHRLMKLGLSARRTNVVLHSVTAALGVTACLLAFFPQKTTIAVLMVLAGAIFTAVELLRLFERRG